MSFLERLRPAELTKEQQILRANEATRLLKNEILQAAVDEAEYTWLSLWHDTSDESKRAKCHSALLAISEVRRVLEKFAGDGALESGRQKK